MALAWGGLIRSPFLYDDHVVIERDAYIGALRGGDAHTTGMLDGLWLQPRMLRALSHRLDAKLFGPQNATAAHAVNLALHWLTAVLWFLLLRRIGRDHREAFAASLIFAVLPVCGEALGIVSHRKESLAAIFVLIGLIVSVRRPLAALLPFALAVLGKETALVFPALFLLCANEARLNEDGGGGRVITRKTFAAYAVAAAAMVALAYIQVKASMAEAQIAPVETPRPGHLHGDVTVASAVGWALWALPRYLARMAWPIGHCIDPALPVNPSVWDIVLGGLALATALVAVWRAYRVRSRYFLPLAWILAALAPVLLPPLIRGGGVAVLADRYAYMAALGVSLLVATALRGGWRLRGAAILAIAFAIAARCEARAYSGERALWERATRLNGRSYLAQYNLAFEAWRKRGDFDDARRHFESMAAIRPDFAQGMQAYINFIAEREGSAKAMEWLDGRIGERGSPLFLRKSRGGIRSVKGDLKGAEEDFRACLAGGLDDSAVRHNLGVVLQRQLRWKEAAAEFAVSGRDKRLGDDVLLSAALGGKWKRRTTPGGTGRVLIVGDSVPCGVGSEPRTGGATLAERMNALLRKDGRSYVACTNAAVPGSLLHNLPDRLPMMLDDASVSRCVIMSGHNDAFAGAPPNVLMRDMADAILICRMRGVDPVVIGPIPVVSARERDRRRQERILSEWNRNLRAFCNDNGVAYVSPRSLFSGMRASEFLDLATGNHLNESGMRRLARAVCDVLRRLNGAV